ncbi:hypothetical protein [Pseudochryseolinea flava]|uniref:Uncharacterized protein n=1 Tax=Pseudochryseolinea flava TaxID=2059302 RepID=A0A364Y7R4_9BACT|nr:hypothetical protein [Pseudochryseolinea flava]RAW02990.1 hypothetical protein DQQ10_02485 [Pseudochryseolinea flava]
MHQIEPYYNWLKYYNPAEDDRSPFFGKQYNFDVYSETIYGYYIDPAWDNIGSETLFIKILYTDYQQGFTIIEFIGEWNDAINNDIMTLKRNIIEAMMAEGIFKFILIGENIMNFHGSDDSYYEEWFEEVEDEGGWIAAISFPDFVFAEMSRFRLDHYILSGGTLSIDNWRTFQPTILFDKVDGLVQRRLN